MAIINNFPKGSGGGKVVETVLWTNPNPTDAVGRKVIPFNATTIRNYQYLKISFRMNGNTDPIHYAYGSVAEAFNFTDSQTPNYAIPLSLGAFGALDEPFTRVVATHYEASDNAFLLAIQPCEKYNGGQDNNYLIPYQVIGLNRLVEPKIYEDVLWENANPTTAFANQTVTLTDSLANYDAVRIYFNWSTSRGDRHTQHVDYDLTYINEYITGNYYRMMIGMVYNNVTYTRNAFIGEGYTSVVFGTSARLNASGSNNSTNIPIKICGIKYA